MGFEYFIFLEYFKHMLLLPQKQAICFLKYNYIQNMVSLTSQQFSPAYILTLSH